MLLKCVAGWVLALIVVGITAAVLVGPSPNPEKALFCDFAEYDKNVTAFLTAN